MMDANARWLTDWIADRVEVGDLLLSGGHDPVSVLIQKITNSPYSHAAIVTSTSHVTEAYDYALTLSEEDEGVYETSFGDFAIRSKGLSELAIYRPPPHDVDRLSWYADALHETTPTYPTTAGVMLLMIEALERLPRIGRRDPQRRHAWIEAQASFLGDGPRRVQCAELATRLYAAAGLHLDFRHPLLSRYMDVVNGPGDYLADGLPSPIPDRVGGARRGRWNAPGAAPGPKRSLVRGLVAVSDLASATTSRALYAYKPDIADYVMPNDFTTAHPLRRIGYLRLNRRGETLEQSDQPMGLADPCEART